MDYGKLEERRLAARKEMIDAAQAYIDPQLKTIDIKSFYRNNPDYKNKIPYYFTSKKDFYEEVGVISANFKYVKKTKENSEDYKLKSVRDLLALDRLKQLIEEGNTLEKIGDMYNVTKQCVDQLIKRLDNGF